MKTFEQTFKQTLNKWLKEFINKPIITSNDISFEPLYEDPNTLAVIIRTAPGITSGRKGYDLTTATFYIDMITNINDIQVVQGAVNNMIMYYNGEWQSFEIPIYDPATDETTETEFIYKPIFSTMFIPGQPFDLRTKRETISAIVGKMSITVSYSSTATTKPDDYKLIIANEEYDLNFSSYNFTSAPAYETDQKTDDIFISNHLLSVNQTYQFVLLKQKNDILHNLLSEDFFQTDKENFLAGKKLKLKSGDITIDISSYVLSEQYANGATVITLVLTR